MSDLISREAAIDEFTKQYNDAVKGTRHDARIERIHHAIVTILQQLPSAEPEIIRCCKCAFWDRDTLRYQFNDFRNWNEAECKVLAERDGYNEISHYVEADDFCSYAERRTDG